MLYFNLACHEGHFFSLRLSVFFTVQRSSSQRKIYDRCGVGWQDHTDSSRRSGGWQHSERCTVWKAARGIVGSVWNIFRRCLFCDCVTHQICQKKEYKQSRCSRMALPCSWIFIWLDCFVFIISPSVPPEELHHLPNLCLTSIALF